MTAAKRVQPALKYISKRRIDGKAMHYWLRPIESGQLGFQNFASHFIFFQIFQIDFQPCPSFYPHPIISDIFLGDQMIIFRFL